MSVSLCWACLGSGLVVNLILLRILGGHDAGHFGHSHGGGSGKTLTLILTLTLTLILTLTLTLTLTPILVLT